MRATKAIIATLVLVFTIALAFCSPPKPEPAKTCSIAEADYNPAYWGKDYPLEYDSWLKTKDPKPTRKSKYKKGWDSDLIVYDKLSEFPYMSLLFNGWGFGVEYNEPRGHHYMVIDQLEIDPSRLKAGGSCLTCKSPYAPKLMKELGPSYFADPYFEVQNKIPKDFQRIGASCVDCHNKKTMGLQFSRWTLNNAMKAINKEPDSLTNQESRSAICGQCHATYIIPKDADMKSTSVFFPWHGSTFGNIRIENIIKVIRSNPANSEWVQNVTGFKVGFIRHPEYEFFTNNSVHAKVDVACADCHMPYTMMGANKISDHDITSPLKKDMQACQQCHDQGLDWLKNQVITIQDRTVSMISRAGYACAVTAKIFETTHKAQKDGKVLDQNLYDKAKDLYLEAFYRVIYIGAENSIGFHNPSEAGRICTDAMTMANKSESLLRQALTKAGVYVPTNIELEIAKYINDRGVKKLMFRPELEFKDP